MNNDTSFKKTLTTPNALLPVVFTAFIALLPTNIAAAHEPGNSLQVIAAAHSLGLDSSTLACLDVNNDEPAEMLDRLTAEYTTYEEIQSLQAEIFDHQQMLYEAKAVLRNFAGDAQAQTALDEAQSQIMALSSLVRSTRISLISTLLDELADASMISEVLEAEGFLLALPPQYRLAVDTFEDAKELAWALQMQERADTTGSELNPNAQQILQDAHAQSDVQLGKVRVETFANANKTAMDQWVLMN